MNLVQKVLNSFGKNGANESIPIRLSIDISGYSFTGTKDESTLKIMNKNRNLYL